MRIRHLFLVVGLAASAVAGAQTQVIDFTGSLTQVNETFGADLAPGTVVPGIFTGSFVYNPAATALSDYIRDVTVKFSTFEIQKQFVGDPGAVMLGVNSLEFAETGSLGLSGQFQQLEMNSFSLKFAGSQPVDLHNVDFASFSKDTLAFDIGSPHAGDINAVGDFVVVSAPEPSEFALLLGALLPIGLILHRKRRARDARDLGAVS